MDKPDIIKQCRHCSKFKNDNDPKPHRVYLEELVNQWFTVCRDCEMVENYNE